MNLTETKNFIFRHRQPIAWALVLLWAGAIFLFSSQPGDAIPAQLEIYMSFFHFCEYWLLSVLIVGAVDMPWRRSWKTAIIAMVLGSCFGITDEFHQLFVDGRFCDVTDWLVDTAGATVGSLAGSWFLVVFRLYKEDHRKRKEARKAGKQQ